MPVALYTEANSVPPDMSQGLLTDFYWQFMPPARMKYA
jgi:hypothetical protein